MVCLAPSPEVPSGLCSHAASLLVSKAADSKTDFRTCGLTQGLRGLALGQANVGSALIPSHVALGISCPCSVPQCAYKMTSQIVPIGMSKYTNSILLVGKVL